MTYSNKRGKGVNSIGTCSICGYTGPGPEHTCITESTEHKKDMEICEAATGYPEDKIISNVNKEWEPYIKFREHYTPSKVRSMLQAAEARDREIEQLKTENERLQAEWTDVPDEYENWRDFARYMQDLVDTRDDTFEKMMDQRDAALAENEQLKAENELLKTKLTELEESCITLIRVCKWCKSEYTGRCCKNCEQEAGEV